MDTDVRGARRKSISLRRSSPCINIGIDRASCAVTRNAENAWTVERAAITTVRRIAILAIRNCLDPKDTVSDRELVFLSMDSGDPDTIVTSNVSSYAKAQVASLFENGSNGAARHEIKESQPVKSNNGTGGGRAFGGTEVCHRCNKAVYMAERMIGAGAAWHKITCFTCFDCKRRLESTSLCEKDGEIYCKTCYGKRWGPKGYGFGIGAGTLQMQQ